MSDSIRETTVGQLVAERPQRARVFERWGIDYCCGGRRSLIEACEAKKLDSEAVLRELYSSDALPERDQRDWTRAPMSELADHIEQSHHAYLRSELPRLSGLIDKVVNAHGERHPALKEAQDVFRTLRQELETHTAKEELILFPMIREMELSPGPVAFHCGSVRNPIFVMEMDHDAAGHALERLRALTGDYTAPPDACGTYRAMLSALEELEADLHLHIHKENNILFPRAIAREAVLSGTGS